VLPPAAWLLKQVCVMMAETHGICTSVGVCGAQQGLLLVWSGCVLIWHSLCWAASMLLNGVGVMLQGHRGLQSPEQSVSDSNSQAALLIHGGLQPQACSSQHCPLVSF